MPSDVAGLAASFRIGEAHMAPFLLAARAAETPAAVALQNVATGESWSYQELLDSVRRYASAFVAAGLEPGDFVVTMVPEQGDGIRTWLGAAFAGAVEVPINPRYRGSLLRELLAEVSPRLLVASSSVLADIDPDDLAAAGTIMTIDSGPAGRAARSAHALASFSGGAVTVSGPPALRAGDVAAVIFTSGTTGPSKGVILTWAGVYQMVSWVPADAYGPGDGVFCPLPMFHLAAKSAFTNALARQARFAYRAKFSASSFLDDVRSAGCTTANIVGPMFSMLAGVPERPDDASGPLRVIICGPMIPDIEHVKRRFGVDVVTCYGMTEIGSVLTTTYEHGPWNSCGRVRAGFPWPEVRIVDADGRDVVPGAVGELIVRPAQRIAFSPGYLNDPSGTAQAWRDGWFHSGDALRTDESGNYYLVDRYKDAIRRRGENVSSFEIESIVTAHPAVSECAAVGVPGAHGDDDILIFLIPAESGEVDTEKLGAWVDERVPPHMRPSQYRVVADFPRNATTMRVKKYELRRMARDA
jgi:crotonobetaine/carnitine-CoA ligase